MSMTLPVIPATAGKGGCANCKFFARWGDAPAYAEQIGYKLDISELVAARGDDQNHCHNVHEEVTRCNILLVADSVDRFVDGAGGWDKSSLMVRMANDAMSFVKGFDNVVLGFTALVRCAPPTGKDSVRAAVSCCSGGLLEEIERRRPQVVMPMGALALEFLTGRKGGLSMSCGVLQSPVVKTLHKFTVVGGLHPYTLLKVDSELERFATALDAACALVAAPDARPVIVPRVRVLTTVLEVRDSLRRLATCKTVAFDTETGSLDPHQTKFPPLLCFSFSGEAGESCVVPYDHAESPFAADCPERRGVKEELIRFFTSPVRKVAQNAKFDLQHIRVALGVEVADPVLDTMLIHYLLDETVGTHGLENLTHKYTTMGAYFSGLDEYVQDHLDANPKKGGSYAAIPAKFLFPYAGMDADATLRVYHALRKSEPYASDKALKVLGTVFLPKLARLLSNMEFRGATLSRKIARQCAQSLERRIAKNLANMRALPEVAAMGDAVNFKSPKALADIIFRHGKLAPKGMTDKKEAAFRANLARLEGDEKALRWRFKVSDIHVQKLLAAGKYEYFSLDKNALESYCREGNRFCDYLLAYRRDQKILSTYFTPLLESGARVIHTNFSPVGAVTGRLSSSHPNLQNIPEFAKNVYISRFPDGLLLSADFSQIELRVAAAAFNDRSMIDAYRKGIDLHEQTAAMLIGKSLVEYRKLPDAERKNRRTCAKRMNFGIIYGIGAPGLQGTLEQDGVFMRVQDIQKMLDDFKKVRPRLFAAMGGWENQTKRDGQCRTFTGRIRRLPEVRASDEGVVSRALRQSVNVRVQSGASDIMEAALIYLDGEMTRRKMQAQLILTVHDSLTVDCPVNELVRVAKLVKHTMENIPTLADDILPGVDWSWLTVPLVADVEAGYTLGSPVGFDPFTFGDVPAEPLFTEDGGVFRYRKPANKGELILLAQEKYRRFMEGLAC